MAGSNEEGFTITRDFVVAMLEHLKARNTIHRRFAFQIILQVPIPTLKVLSLKWRLSAK